MKISDKCIVKHSVLDVPVSKAWQLWTTHEGLKSFIGQDNKVELLIGGKFEIYFLMDNQEGFKGSEGCRILSYLPEEMLSFSWNVPPRFESLRASEYKTWVVILFRGTENRKTEIELSHLGWPEDDDWVPVYEYFTRAWEIVMKNLSSL